MSDRLARVLRGSRLRATRALLALAARAAGGDGDTLIRILHGGRPLSADLLVRAYANGFFPMADETTGRVHWFDPPQRGVLPIEGVDLGKHTLRLVRQARFQVTLDAAFEQVVAHCARNARRQDTWITDEVAAAYLELHRMGAAHSVEVWQEGALVGGMYGVTLGSYFAGESQFHLVSNAGAVGFHHLCEGLRASGFLLHDIQYLKPHLEKLGAVALPREEFRRRLAEAIARPARLALAAGADGRS
jgi:leucyl/phenylalanyl-tRNA---protein transferase